MSRENVEVVHRVVATWNASDIGRWLELCTPDIEVVFPDDVPEPGPFHGREELRGWAEGFMAAWDDFHAEIRQTIPAGEEVVVELYQRGHGRDTGIELDQTDWHIFTVREGRIARWRDYWTRDEALEAVGLQE
jgi:ketosteroid isomerase-like protein